MADLNAPSRKSNFLIRWGRTWVSLGTGLFVVSTAFPVIASLSVVDQLPPWIGFLDVTLALILVLLAIGLDILARDKLDLPVIQTSYRLYRLVAGLPLVLLVIFFLFGDGVKWHILLPGLAWRTWLLLYILPAAISAWRTTINANKRQ